MTVTPNPRLSEVVFKRNPAIGHSHTSHLFASCVLNRIHLRTMEYIVTYMHILYITVHQCMAFSPVDSSSAVAVVAGGGGGGRGGGGRGGGGGGGVQYLKAHLAHDLVEFPVWIESIKHSP